MTVARPHLIGAYPTPRLAIGDEGFCLYRSRAVVITSISVAPIPWPRCRTKGTNNGAGSGLLLDETLARAVRTESSIAIQHHWGVSKRTVWEWRQALGVGQWETPGSRSLLDAMTMKANDAWRGKKHSPSTIRRLRANANAMDLGRHLAPFSRPRKWEASEARLLGTMPDTDLARRLGLTIAVVRGARVGRGIPAYRKPMDPASEERGRLRRQGIARKAASDRKKARGPQS